MGSKNAKPSSKNSTSISPTENMVNCTKQQQQHQLQQNLEQTANNANGPSLAVRLNEDYSDDVFFNNRSDLIGQILDKNTTSTGR